MPDVLVLVAIGRREQARDTFRRLWFDSHLPKMVSFIGECAKMRVKLKVPIVRNLHSD